MRNKKGLRVKKIPFISSIITFLVMEILVGFSDDFIVMTLRFVTCIVFSYCIYKGSKEKMVLNPYYLFCLTPFSLLVYSEKVSTYYLSKLEIETWFLAIINMTSFLLAYRLTKKSKTIEDLASYKGNEVSINKLKEHAIILAVVGRIPTIVLLALHVSIPFSSVIGFLSYIGIAFAFKSKDKKIMLITILITSIMFLTDFNKTRNLYLVMTIIVCAELFLVESKQAKLKLIGLVLLGSLAFIIISFPLKSFTREGGSFFDFIINFSEISATAFSHYDNRITFDGPPFLQMPYMYLVSAWNNVQYVMQTQDTRTYGLWMLKPLLGYLQVDVLLSSFYELIPSSTFNTFTYISVLFKDFGYYGSCLGSVILGWYVKKVRTAARKDGSAFAAASYALVGMATLEMFFSNHFFSLSYPFTIVIIGWIYKKIFKLERY